MLIDTTGNSIGWYCFHASCKAKGKHEGQKTMDYVTKTFSNKNVKLYRTRMENISSSLNCNDFLK